MISAISSLSGLALSIYPFAFDLNSSSPGPGRPPLFLLDVPLPAEKQGEVSTVMWPRLVANKIVRKTLGSNNFVADFPVTTQDLEEEEAGKTDNKYKVFVGSWNVGGVRPPQDLDMEDWLDTYDDTPCDIYVLGFQEVVPLQAGNILGPENNKICLKWNSLIREALNKKICQESSNLRRKDFKCIVSKQMVGIFISVWVPSDIHPYIQHPSVSCVGCGIMGCLGNKGSVSVRFRLHGTSFCFVCCHLASGGSQVDERNRNANAADIFSRTTFPQGPCRDMPPKILDHDRVILLGDLNYRISLPEGTTRVLVERKEWDTLLENDQLRVELMDGQVFQGWCEGRIKFSPTYKYYVNSDVYYGCIQGKKGEKKRAPAWCDRIIWYGKGLKQHVYARGESKLSDHRPVKAIFTTEVGVLNAARGLQRLFLSDRFHQITSHFDTDGFLCQGRSSLQI